jgi:uncharacterized protein (DUF1015 family)
VNVAVFVPFQPLRYNPALVSDLARVVAPPYDVISDAERDRLYDRDPHNVVRLILNRSPDPYVEAAASLQTWRREGVLLQEPTPLLVYHVEQFRVPGGSERQRSGVIGVARLERFEDRVILPHERTLARPKEDRLRLIRACRANLSPVFGLFDDASDILGALGTSIGTRTPDVTFHDDMGVTHRLWLVRDPKLLAGVSESLRKQLVFIADGHHRYETALAYRDERIAAGQDDPQAAHNFVLMYLTATTNPGVVVLPTHRLLSTEAMPAPANVLQRLRGTFHLEAFGSEQHDAFRRRLHESPEARFGLALAGIDEIYIATLPDAGAVAPLVGTLAAVVRDLDVALLDRAVLRGLLDLDCTRAAQEGRLLYTHDDEGALAAIGKSIGAAFMVKAPRIADVVRVCLAGETMPEKSTYFFPKLLTGVVFHSLD